MGDLIVCSQGFGRVISRENNQQNSQSFSYRALRRLDAIDSAISLNDLNVPGFNFHGLEGKPKRFSIHINGPWCITFEWLEQNAYRVNLENDH